MATKEDIAFTQGMICAAAMFEGHNTSGEEVLGACGNIDWSQIDSHDIELLKTTSIDLSKFGYKE